MTEKATKPTIEYLDRVPSDWFALDVMPEKSRSRNWVALLVDVDPDELKNCICNGPAMLYVHPNDYRPRDRIARQAWFRVPGKHKNKDLAWDALQEVMVTRH
jgi:hypothetical protein